MRRLYIVLVLLLASCSYANDFVNPFGLDKENPLGNIAKIDEQIRLLLAVDRLDADKTVYKYKAKKTDETIAIDLDGNNKIIRVTVHTVGQSSQIASFFTAYWRKVNGSDAAPRQVTSADGKNYDRADLSTDAASGVWLVYQESQELEISLKGYEKLPRS